ncbi:hypothetical protein AB0K18_45275 [Nonomuraea sp. NPDC049421]|uniref:hypothetical protein n=1 Tax=Nonomuraea sp. NPDC049421 TaxID=3155275 RepID=UPI00342AE82B
MYVIPDNRVEPVPNVGIVIGSHAALIIDTGMGPRNGAYVLEQARRLPGDRRLYLMITRFHPEHGFGAQVFKGTATIVCNAAQRVELHRKGTAYVEMFKGLSPAVATELEGVELADPDLVYESEAEIDSRRTSRRTTRTWTARARSACSTSWSPSDPRSSCPARLGTPTCGVKRTFRAGGGSGASPRTRGSSACLNTRWPRRSTTAWGRASPRRRCRPRAAPRGPTPRSPAATATSPSSPP